MTRSTQAENLQHIRRAVRSPRVAALPLPVRLLAYAAANPRAGGPACVRCHRELPAYVDAELDGRLPPLAESFSRQHLLVCASCSQDYTDLLDAAILSFESRLAKPPQMPRPDLGFLEDSSG
ncbi:MAG: hypothetical protein M1482_12580 [Chloroflexi bacterium]|nr:hypothetical protein [Chloroflexota bacterium]